VKKLLTLLAVLVLLAPPAGGAAGWTYAVSTAAVLTPGAAAGLSAAIAVAGRPASSSGPATPATMATLFGSTSAPLRLGFALITRYRDSGRSAAYLDQGV
jgi:hypothetical protein